MQNRNRLLLSGLVVLLLAALTAAGLMLTRGYAARSSRDAEGDETARKSGIVQVGKSVEDGKAPVARAGNTPVTSPRVKESRLDAAEEEEVAEPASGETNGEEAEPPPSVSYQVRGHFEFTGLAGLDLAALAALLEKETLPFEIRLMNGTEIDWQLGGQLPLDGKFASEEDRSSLPLTEDGKLKTGRWEATVALLDGAKPVQIAAPYLGERLLDFGEMNIDLASLLGDQRVVVTGRLLHSSGPAMAKVGLDIKALAFKPKTNEEANPVTVSPETSDNGVFLSLTTLGGRAPSSFAWTLALNGSGGAGAMKLLVPPTAGTVIDFGAITFKCPVVELRAKGWIPDSERLLRAGPDTKIEDLGDPVLNVTFSAFEQQFSGALARSQSKLIMYMAPGNYECSGSVDDPYTDYKDIESSIEVTEEGTLPYTLYLYKASPKTEPQPAAPPRPAPVIETPKPGKVKVMLPKLPEPLADTASEVALIAIPRVAGAEARTLLKNPGRQEFWEGELPPGSWDILLTEAGPHFGYENGVVSGPERADVGSNANIVVWLPAVDKPLWKEPVNSFAVKFTCEGQPIELTGPFVCGGGGFMGMAAYGTTDGMHSFDAFFSGPRQKITLADGDKEIEFAMRPGEGGEGSISHDFPCRVEVRFSRNGAPATLPCWVRGESGDSYRCEVMSTNGKPVLLWLPPGKATISLTTVATEPETFTRQVEVKRDARLVVEFALDSSRLAVNWAERYMHESNTNWLITDSQGHYVGFASHPARYTKLEPGHYIIAPWYDFERKQAITFNIVAGSDTEIDLPFVTPIDECAEIVLPYPHDLRPDSGGYYDNVGGYPTGFGDMETARHWLPEISTVSSRCTAEGVVIYLPVGVEFVVFAAVANYDHENGGLVARKSWCMTPRRMKVTSTERLRLGNVWTEGVALATSWDKVTCDFRMAPENNPLGVYYDQSWRVLPDGGYKLTWETPATGGNPLAHTFLLNLSGTMGIPNRLPEALKREFEEAGLYQP